MPDIFGRTSQIYGGGITSDASYMYWSNMPNNGLGMLVTQMQIQYQQPVRRIYEIGPWMPNTVSAYAGQPVYYVAGRPEGQLQLSRIVGPTLTLSTFYRTFGNVCNSNNNLMFITGIGCIGAGAATSLITGPAAPQAPQGGTGFPTGTFPAVVPYINPPPSLPANAVNSFTNNLFGLVGWYMTGCVLTQIGIQINAQDMLVNENSMLMFIGLNLYTSTVSGGVLGQWAAV